MKPMSGVAISVSNAIAWFLIVLGVYLITHGHRTPGGGFAGAAVIVGCLPLTLSSWGKKRFDSWLREGVYGLLELIGLVLFFSLACMGFPRYPSRAAALVGQGGEPLPFGGTLSLVSVAVGFIAVGAFSLTLIYLYGSIRMMETGAGLGGERGHDRYDR